MSVVLPDVPNCLKVNLVYTVGADLNAETVHHFTYTGGNPSTADCVSIATGISNAWGANLRAFCTTAITITGIKVLDLNSRTGAQGIFSPGVAGSRAGAILPANAAVVMAHTIARRYRGGHPRTYLPFLVQGDLSTQDLWNGTVIASLTTAYNAWVTAVKALSAGSTILNDYVTVSYYNNKVLRPTPLVESITSSVGRTTIGSQRRRIH